MTDFDKRFAAMKAEFNKFSAEVESRMNGLTIDEFSADLQKRSAEFDKHFAEVDARVKSESKRIEAEVKAAKAIEMIENSDDESSWRSRENLRLFMEDSQRAFDMQNQAARNFHNGF